MLTVLIQIGIITTSFIPSTREISSYDMARNLQVSRALPIYINWTKKLTIFAVFSFQDFMICFEMLVAAIAHTFVFSHKPFIDDSRVTNPMFYSLQRIIDLSDERHDVYDHIRHISKFYHLWNQKISVFFCRNASS